MVLFPDLKWTKTCLLIRAGITFFQKKKRRRKSKIKLSRWGWTQINDCLAMPICYPWSTFPTLKPLVVASNSLNHTEHPSVSAPGRHSLQPSPFWTKASAAPLLWSVKKTWCGWMQKNSITNRAHLHNFHQPILSCQKGLLLIGLEGKRKEESVEDGIGSWGPLNAHVWLIKVEGFFFSPLILHC